jgi:hypothetical protein
MVVTSSPSGSRSQQAPGVAAPTVLAASRRAP